MALSDANSILLPLLELSASGSPVQTIDLCGPLSDRLGLPCKAPTSGPDNYLAKRIHLALNLLKDAGLMSRLATGKFEITAKGLLAIAPAILLKEAPDPASGGDHAARKERDLKALDRRHAAAKNILEAVKSIPGRKFSEYWSGAPFRLDPSGAEIGRPLPSAAALTGKPGLAAPGKKGLDPSGSEIGRPLPSSVALTGKPGLAAPGKKGKANVIPPPPPPASAGASGSAAGKPATGPAKPSPASGTWPVAPGSAVGKPSPASRKGTEAPGAAASKPAPEPAKPSPASRKGTEAPGAAASKPAPEPAKPSPASRKGTEAPGAAA
ncbi:MAG: hypothetical protein LBQ12_07970, partial [Deltaproteobacteria bacterium]|nr:hypothetical protein [Deltaproteobacteria bacterium]